MSEFADGPAMQALTEKQRLFVLAHAANPMGKGADWARQAGYSDGKGKNCAVIAVTLLRHPGVVEAMFEVSRLAFRAKGPAIAADALLRIAQTDGHKDQARAAIAVMDRAGMGPLQNIHVEHHHSMNESEMIARIKELASRNGAKLLGTNTQTIDGEFVEIPALNGAGGEWQARSALFRVATRNGVLASSLPAARMLLRFISAFIMSLARMSCPATT